MAVPIRQECAIYDREKTVHHLSTDLVESTKNNLRKNGKQSTLENQYIYDEKETHFPRTKVKLSPPL